MEVRLGHHLLAVRGNQVQNRPDGSHNDVRGGRRLRAASVREVIMAGFEAVPGYINPSVLRSLHLLSCLLAFLPSCVLAFLPSALFSLPLLSGRLSGRP